MNVKMGITNDWGKKTWNRSISPNRSRPKVLESSHSDTLNQSSLQSSDTWAGSSEENGTNGYTPQYATRAEKRRPFHDTMWPGIVDFQTLDPEADEQNLSHPLSASTTLTSELRLVYTYPRPGAIPCNLLKTIDTKASGNPLVAEILLRHLADYQLPLSLWLKKLVELPEDSNELFQSWYRRVLSGIPRECQTWACEVLKWVVFAVRPLTLEELADALEPVYNSDFEGSIGSLAARAAILEEDLYTTKLITLFRSRGQGSQKVFEPMDSSLVIFLQELNGATKDWYHLNAGEAHREITGTCLVHMNCCQVSSEAEVGTLRRYAEVYWEEHLHAAESAGSILIDFKKEMATDTPLKTLHIATDLGLSKVIQSLAAALKGYFTPMAFSATRAIRRAAENQDEATLAALLKLTPANAKQTWLFQSIVTFAQGDKLLELLLTEFPQLATNKIDSADNSTPLHLAAKLGLVNHARHLLRFGAKVYDRDNFYFTPLARAAAGGSCEVVELLLQAAKDTNEEDTFEPRTFEQVVEPLAQAAARGHTEVVKMLLKQPATNIRRRSGPSRFSALHFASINNQPEAVRVLIECGAPIRFPDKDSWSPVHIAAYHGALDAAKVLLDYPDGRSLIHGCTVTGATPLYLAAQAGHLGLVKLLLEFGACPNEADFNNSMPLHAAAAGGHVECVRFLLERGADPERRRRYDRNSSDFLFTPADIALSGQVKELLKNSIWKTNKSNLQV